MKDIQKQKRLEELFLQWCNHAIEESDVPELMNLLRDADAEGMLEQMPDAVYTQIKNASFFTEEEKEKIYAYAVGTPVAGNKGKRKALYTTGIAASIVILIGLGLYALLAKKSTQNNIIAAAKTDIAAPTKFNGFLSFGTKNLSFNDASLGTIAEQGNVQVVKHTNGLLSFEGTSKDIVFNTLTVPKGSKPLQVELADGTSVVLNVASTLRFPNTFSGKERRVYLTGEAYFEVIHDAEHPFIVSVGKSEIKDLGTHFNVDAYNSDSAMRVTLYQGKVDVNDKLVLTPGEQALIRNSKTELNQSPNLQESIAWKDGEFVFDGEDVQAILSELSKWYNFTVEYKSSLPKGHFSGSISRNNNLSQVLQILEASGLNFKIEGNKVTVE